MQKDKNHRKLENHRLFFEVSGVGFSGFVVKYKNPPVSHRKPEKQRIFRANGSSVVKEMRKSMSVEVCSLQGRATSVAIGLI